MQKSQGVIKLQSMAAEDFKDALSGDGDDVISELISLVELPAREGFWQQYTNDVMLYLQNEVEAGYCEAEETQR